MLPVGGVLLMPGITGVRQATQQRLRAIGRRGKRARRRGEHGHAEPAV
ncbi:hypothetical protein [Streptomyces sp. NPDC054940]